MKGSDELNEFVESQTARKKETWQPDHKPDYLRGRASLSKMASLVCSVYLILTASRSETRIDSRPNLKSSWLQVWSAIDYKISISGSSVETAH